MYRLAANKIGHQAIVSNQGCFGKLGVVPGREVNGESKVGGISVRLDDKSGGIGI